MRSTQLFDLLQELRQRALKGSVSLTEATISESLPKALSQNSPPPRPLPPFSEEHIRKALGLGDDVQVRIFPVPGLKDRLNAGKGLDLDDILDKKVTATVTEALIPHVGDDPEEPWIDPVAPPKFDNDNLDPDVAEAVDGVLEEVYKEISRAMTKHPVGMNSAHEGYSVILEELDELWDLVKADRGYSGMAREEAIQIAAMAIRYIVDLDPQYRAND